MSRPPASGLVHSVQARLKNEARESDRPFAELLELYAVERFLHRLGRSPHRDHFVLKGALLLRHWLIGVVASVRRLPSRSWTRPGRIAHSGNAGPGVDRGARREGRRMPEAKTTRAGRPGRRFKPYPAYKDSGVEWLGEIPAHWEVIPIRSLAKSGYKTFVDGDWIESPFIRDEGIRLIQTGNIGIAAYKEQGFRYIDDETFRGFRCTEVLPGDVLICRLADPVGRACLAPDLGCRMITSVDVCILKTAPDVHAAFVVYALSGGEYLSWMSGICRGGTRDRVSRSMLDSIRVQKPPLHEQRAIAAFLDRETARIDALVAKKERLIELLQEKRTALITRAVTKGLDPNVPMKDSGVEWLGEIPAHWDVKRVKNLSRFVTSGSRGWAEYYTDEGSLFLRIGNLRADSIDLDLSDVQHVNPPPGAEGERTRVRSGDVLISITALIGAIGVVSEAVPDAFVNQHLALVRPSDKQVGARWLGYCVFSRVGQEQLRAELYGGTKDGLSLDDIRSLVVLVPPWEEQQRIVGILDTAGKEVDALVAKVRDAIDRLKELRTALISAAVTGKIDVPGHAA